MDVKKTEVEKTEIKKIKNDFIHMFRSLDAAEQTAFRQYFVHFYGQQKALLTTLDRVEKVVTKQQVQAFLDSIEKDKKTLNDLSDLKKWLLEFLTVQEVKNNGYQTQLLTLDALRKRGLTDVLAKKTKHLNADLTTNQSTNIWHTFIKLGLDHDAYFNTQNDKLDNHQVGIEQLLGGLDNFYISTKLKYAVELQSRTNILKENHQPKLLEEILSLIETDTSLSPLIYGLYLPLFQLAKDKSETAYEHLEAFLLNDKRLGRAEKLPILLYLLNFCAIKVRDGDKTYISESFKLVKIGIEQSLFNATGFFPIRTFNNIVNIGSFMEKYEWTEKFIKDWSVHLDSDDTSTAHNLALARLHFAKKEFDVAHVLLSKLARHKNIHFSIDIRTLLARVYYEKGQKPDVQNNHCDALELYIRRIKKVDDALRKSALNFVIILHLLINEKPKQQILNTFNAQTEPIMYADWLTTKIEECKH
jgi:tetratricopeptide (TPR) repeat protein